MPCGGIMPDFNLRTTFFQISAFAPAFATSNVSSASPVIGLGRHWPGKPERQSQNKEEDRAFTAISQAKIVLS